MDFLGTLVSDSASNPLDALRRVFGYDAFRPGQREVVECVLRGEPVLAVMPTGAGKSLCFQLPAVMSGGTTLVISPLIALMKDQVDELTRLKIPATVINSSIPYEEQRERLIAMRARQYRLVYVAPERFRSPTFCRAIEFTPIDAVAIDEAHCISEWGHDFRPDYLRLQQVIELVKPRTVVALTATATPVVQIDILKQLNLPKARRLVTGFDRPNLNLSARSFSSDGDKKPFLRRFLKNHDGPGIVYVGTRKLAEQVADDIFALGLKAECYHAGLADKVRHEVQDRFRSNQTRIIVATSAFGMGIDKRDLRWVFHYTMPGSAESYYQEAGRAGRDGEPADCMLCSSPADFRLQRFFIDQSFPDKRTIGAVYETVVRGKGPVWSEGLGALAAASSATIGSRLGMMEVQSALRVLEAAQAVEVCDSASGGWAALVTHQPVETLEQHLNSPQEKRVLTGLREMASVAEPGLYRFSLESIGRSAGMDREIVRRILVNVSKENLLEFFSPLTSEAIRVFTREPFKDLPIDWSSYARQKEAEDQKLRWMGRYAELNTCRRKWITAYFGQSDISISGCGCDNCDDRPKHTLDVLNEPVAPKRPSKLEAPKKPAPKPAPRPASEDVIQVFNALKQLRKEVARKKRTKPFKVLSDAVLMEIATRRPGNMEDLLQIKGIGPAKASKYGHMILEFLGNDTPPPATQPPPAGPAARTEPATIPDPLSMLDSLLEALLQETDGLRPLIVSRIRHFSANAIEGRIDQLPTSKQELIRKLLGT